MSSPPDSPPPPRWQANSQAQLLELAEQWLASPTLAQLLQTLDAPPPSSPGAEEPLQQWSAQHLDTRAGSERRDAGAAPWPASWPPALLEAAGPLGLMHTAAPGRRFYDVGVVLGGATTGNRLRVELAAEMVADGLKFGQLVGLSAERPLSAGELADEPASAQDATEWRNLLRELRTAFGPLTAAGADGDGSGALVWRDERFDAAGQQRLRLRLVVAPAAGPARRAGTRDAVRFLLERLPRAERRSVLLVSSAVYAPYQFFAVAPLLLRADVEHVELIGTPTSAQGPTPLLAQRIGQEIHAALESALALAHADRTRG